MVVCTITVVLQPYIVYIKVPFEVPPEMNFTLFTNYIKFLKLFECCFVLFWKSVVSLWFPLTLPFENVVLKKQILSNLFLTSFGNGCFEHRTERSGVGCNLSEFVTGTCRLELHMKCKKGNWAWVPPGSEVRISYKNQSI